jgi:hypothetical protein
MDVEVRSMVEEAYNRTLSLIESKKEQVRLIAEYLMEKETITNADVTRLIGAREYSSKERVPAGLISMHRTITRKRRSRWDPSTPWLPLLSKVLRLPPEFLQPAVPPVKSPV